MADSIVLLERVARQSVFHAFALANFLKPSKDEKLSNYLLLDGKVQRALERIERMSVEDLTAQIEWVPRRELYCTLDWRLEYVTRDALAELLVWPGFDGLNGYAWSKGTVAEAAQGFEAETTTVGDRLQDQYETATSSEADKTYQAVTAALPLIAAPNRLMYSGSVGPSNALALDDGSVRATVAYLTMGDQETRTLFVGGE
jgi:hypothetical protein